MTEADWLSSTDPQPMLEYLRGKVSDRKLRLFAVACCHEVSHLWNHPIITEAISISEVKTDEGVVDRSQALLKTITAANETPRGRNKHDYLATLVVAMFAKHTGVPIERVLFNLSGSIAFKEVPSPTRSIDDWEMPSDPKWQDSYFASRRGQAQLLRDIFNPFHPTTLSPTCLTATVTALANDIYTSRAFDRLPILADALEEAGCSSQELLEHLRSVGPHTRGCWALDAVLGKE